MYYVFFILIHLDMFAFSGLLLGSLIYLIRFKRLARGLMVTSSFVLLIIAMTPLARYGLECLENRFPQSYLPEKVDGLILLGGAFALEESVARGFPVYNMTASRLYDFIALMRRYPDAKVVFSGNEVESKLTHQVLAQHEIDPRRVILPHYSHNTRENVENLMKSVPHQPHENWVLVTSAYHMPRSVGLFRGYNWQVIPYPVDYHTSGQTSGYVKFDRYAFVAWGVVMKEIAGMINNWRDGMSPVIFPEPVIYA